MAGLVEWWGPAQAHPDRLRIRGSRHPTLGNWAAWQGYSSACGDDKPVGGVECVRTHPEPLAGFGLEKDNQKHRAKGGPGVSNTIIPKHEVTPGKHD